MIPNHQAKTSMTETVQSAQTPTTEQQLHQQMLEQIKAIVVREKYARAEQMAKATMETTLLDVGLDSLDSVEIVMAIEDDFGISIDDAIIEATQQPTFGDLVRMLDSAVQKKSR